LILRYIEEFPDVVVESSFLAIISAVWDYGLSYVTLPLFSPEFSVENSSN